MNERIHALFISGLCFAGQFTTNIIDALTNISHLALTGVNLCIGGIALYKLIKPKKKNDNR